MVQIALGGAAQMQHWSELRTAWLASKLGTISAAVEMLYILRATVTGRVDTWRPPSAPGCSADMFGEHLRTEADREMPEMADQAVEV